MGGERTGCLKAGNGRPGLCGHHLLGARCHMHGISGWRADPQQLVAAEPGAIQHVLKRRGLAKAA